MADFKNFKVLIIEDDESSANVLSSLLAMLKVECHIVYSGPNIMSVLGDVPPVDVVFIDLEMPGQSGYDLLPNIRAIPALARARLVAYTSHTSHLNTARTAGFHSFLGKPLDGRKLSDQLQRIFADEPVWEVS